MMQVPWAARMPWFRTNPATLPVDTDASTEADETVTDPSPEDA